MIVNTKVEAITTDPPATLDKTNSHTYFLGILKNIKKLAISIEDTTSETQSIDAAEVQVFGYLTETSKPNLINRFLVTEDTGRTILMLDLNDFLSYEYIYINQGVTSAVVGGAGAVNPLFKYEFIIDKEID